MNYQYRAFGVPGLGLKRGLAEDLVIAPYASVAGADGRAGGGVREPAAAGRRGPRGPLRLLRGGRLHAVAPAARARRSAVVRSFMAHHQGMSLLSLAYLLLDRPMQRRFAADPRVPGDRSAAAGARPADRRVLSARGRGRRRRAPPSSDAETPMRVFTHAEHAAPGGAAAVQRPLPRHGHQRRRRLQPLEGPRGHALARGRARATTGAASATCATSTSGEFWSTAHQPTLSAADGYEAIFSRGARRVPPPRPRHRHAHRDRGLARGRHRAAARAASPTARATPRTIEVTSYAEVVLAPRGRRRAAPGLQQPVRADRARARRAGDPLHAPAALGTTSRRRGCST